MSFILDALKKSENARQRQAGPSLFEVKVTPPKRVLPAWAVVAAVVLLAVNATVLGWMLLRRPAKEALAPARAATVRAVPASGASAAAVSAHAVRAKPAGVLSVRSAPESPPVRSSSSTPVGPGGANGPPIDNPSDYAPALMPSTSAAHGRTGPGGGESVPLYQDIASAPGSDLPTLHLDLHVYTAKPAGRFVMINMQKLREGDSLPDGVAVVSIRPDGVVLSFKGRRFLLPR